MQFDTLLFERRDRVAYVTLNRPDRLNALNGAMIADLRAAAAAIDADAGIRAVLLTASGRAFARAPISWAMISSTIQRAAAATISVRVCSNISIPWCIPGTSCGYRS